VRIAAIALLVVLALLAIAFFKAWHEQLDRRADPLLILRRQLAEGKISEEEYLERESALRLTERRRR